MDIKEFLEDGVTPNPDFKKQDDTNKGVEDGTKKTESKTFSAEEHQAELDRVAAKTRSEEKAKLEASFKETLVKEREDWEKKSKMNETQREEARAKEESERLAKEKQEFSIERNKFELSKVMSADGISIEMAELLATADTEVMMANYGILKKAFDESVEKKVNERIKGNTPKDPKDAELTNTGDASTPKQYM